MYTRVCISFVGVGMFLKSKNPNIKVVLADPQVIYTINSCVHSPGFQIQWSGRKGWDSKPSMGEWRALYMYKCNNYYDTFHNHPPAPNLRTYYAFCQNFNSINFKYYCFCICIIIHNNVHVYWSCAGQCTVQSLHPWQIGEKWRIINNWRSVSLLHYFEYCVSVCRLLCCAGIGQGRVTNNVKGAPIDYAHLILDTEAVAMVNV